MNKKILITGGAGFIGSHLADELLKHGYSVRVFDSLLPQVHGEDRKRPEYLDREVELLPGDIRDAAALGPALKGIDAVYHLAAAVGVGQSMYQIARYTGINNGGTAILLECLAKHPVERLVVASSMSIYGEGLYRTSAGDLVIPSERSIEQLKARRWEVVGPDGVPLIPVSTPESKFPALPSIYALSKYDQERMCLTIGAAYDIPTVALRFFNVYGTRQSLSNPYTGVLAIFASRLLNNKPPLINEDGAQKRDFVSVHDVALACRLALESPDAPGRAINVGSGNPISVTEVADRLAEMLEKKHIGHRVTSCYRKGDIRHCFADISLARRLLGYQPRVAFETGIVEVVEWLEGQTAVDHFVKAQQELLDRGLAA
ncbi:MAG: NAD-dependent epimerase/dehydratase family protein [Verrucomicrobia bacterium]|nr:NAD-dependent epimerase/dehydratase family protein [Verrucomicrobiota bacterium]